MKGVNERKVQNGTEEMREGWNRKGEIMKEN